MTYPSLLGGQAPAEGLYYSGAHGLNPPTVDENAAYCYTTFDYREAWYDQPHDLYPCSECSRSVIVVFSPPGAAAGTDYIFVHDRATRTIFPVGGTTSTFDACLSWHMNPAATLVQSGNTWHVTRGSSRVWAQTDSDVALTTANDTIPREDSCLRVQTRPTVQAGGVPVAAAPASHYRTKFHLGPSSLAAMDAAADIPSIDGKVYGSRIGNVVAITAITAGSITAGVNPSYAYTGVNGQTIRHVVADLVPGHAYTLGGVASGTATASAAGVATFTTTGSGGSQTVTLTY